MNKVNPDLFKLKMIIMSSDRVKNLRKFTIGLEPEEKIFYFYEDKVYLKKQLKGKKKVVTRELEKSKSEIYSIIQKEIIDYYNLNLNVERVCNFVLGLDNPLKTYRCLASVDPSNGEYCIKFSFSQVPNAQELELIHKDLDTYVLGMKKQVAAKIIKYLKTRPMEFKNLRAIEYFDERFDIYTFYKATKGKGKSSSVKTELQELFKKYYKKKFPARSANLVSSYSLEDIRKIVHEFEVLYSKKGKSST